MVLAGRPASSGSDAFYHVGVEFTVLQPLWSNFVNCLLTQYPLVLESVYGPRGISLGRR